MDNGATATWSGYNHQGKVGLFVALRQMLELIEPDGEITNDMFMDWYLEYEGPEDFDICNRAPCSDPDYVHSRHQVKAYAGLSGKYFSDYKNVVEPYVNKSGNSMPGFNKSITDENGDVLVGIELPAEKRFIHLVQAVPSWKNDIESNPNAVSPYEYLEYNGSVPKKYCELSNSEEDSELNAPLDEIVYSYLSQLVGEDKSKIKLIWMALQCCLQEKIADCHISGGKPKFTFGEIFSKFLSKNALLDAYTENYSADVLRRGLINIWQDIQVRYDDNGGLEQEAREKIDTWLGEIHKKDNDELKKFIYEFSPNKYPPHESIQMSGFHSVICELIRQVKIIPLTSTFHYKKESMPYYLTTINDTVQNLPTVTLTREINRHIDKSSDNRYRSSMTIVTEHHDFQLDGPSITEKLEFDSQSEQVTTRTIAGVELPSIESYRLRRVVPVNSAITELNGDDDV